MIVAVSTGDEQFSFVTLTDLEENTVIYFTDEEADGDYTITVGNEGSITYTAPSGGVSSGTVITLDTDGSTANSSLTDGDFALGNSGDGIIIYQGTQPGEVSTYIHAFGEDSGDIGSFPAGTITAASGSVLIGNDDGSYSGTTTGTKVELISYINDSSNWTVSGSASVDPPNSFTVNASVYTTVQNGDWDLVATWDLGSVPGANENVVIAYSNDVDEVTSVNSITIQAGARLDVESDLTVATNSSIAAGSKLYVRVDGSYTQTSGDFDNAQGEIKVYKGSDMYFEDANSSITNSGSIEYLFLAKIFFLKIF